MKISTILFTFRRFEKTKAVLEALKNNYVVPMNLVIFQDGKRDAYDEEWDRVNDLIHKQAFCETEVVVSRENKGLVRSVVDGVNYAFLRCDAVIVLEDDCIPSRNFINFMTQCLIKYTNNKRVYGVGGYAWPINVDRDDSSDVYFCGRMSSWGWGIWKDRWAKYTRDIECLDRIRKDRRKSRYLETWGSDLDNMFRLTLKGAAKSWAVFWALKVIEENGVYAFPYKSHIQNIGFDGTGENCGSGAGDQYTVLTEEYDEIVKYNLPETITIKDTVERKFAGFLGSYTAITEYDKRKKNIVVYGVGGYFREHENEIISTYNIIAVIDKGKRGYYAGKDILDGDIGLFLENNDANVIITIADETEREKIRKELVARFGVNENRIISRW